MINSRFDNIDFEEKVLGTDPFDFNAAAIDLFHYQYQNNDFYRKYAGLRKADPMGMHRFYDIPLLPIQFFKTEIIKTGTWAEQMIFTSSGTTGISTSRHYVKDVSLYEKSFLAAFRQFYGSPSDYVILALLPSYLERKGSSLVYMTERLIQFSEKKESGFFLDQFGELHRLLLQMEEKKQPVILLGVSFALLDFFEKFKMKLSHTIVMETGGMKGRKKEITRNELHGFLSERSGADKIHSEYGMTELFSQAYSQAEGRYFCPPWMKVIVTSLNDPMEICKAGENGRINIIDLANIHSCAFIATDDLGKLNEDGSFEVLGRFDNSDMRGCSLLIR